MRKLQSLYIGQEVTRKSFDAGIPDQPVVICGITMNPRTGQEDIHVCTVDRQGQPFVEDGLTLEDFRRY